MDSAAYVIRPYSHLAEVDIRHSQVSTLPRYVVVTSRTMDTQPQPHDRDCPQAHLVLREWIQDLHHPTGGNCYSYLFVGASLQKSKLQEVKAESKSQLARHLLILL
jgi:hypothetical protein